MPFIAHKLQLSFDVPSNFSLATTITSSGNNTYIFFEITLNNKSPILFSKYGLLSPVTFQCPNYVVNSLVCGDMYKIPNVAATVATTKIHKRSLQNKTEQGKPPFIIKSALSSKKRPLSVFMLSQVTGKLIKMSYIKKEAS